MNVPVRRFAAAAIAVLFATAAAAHETSEQGEPADPHAHHHHHTSVDAHTTRSIIEYEVPDVRLVRDDGKTVKLRAVLDAGRTVVLSFIYTTCTTVCPVSSATLANLQGKLGVGNSKVQLVSISIDPDEDTPARLGEYARKFGAGPNWRHYTGTTEASITVQRAFDAYRGDKMNHEPDMYIRKAGAHSWVRLRGFATADDLLAETGAVVASK
jgi:protein SCO1/2